MSTCLLQMCFQKHAEIQSSFRFVHIICRFCLRLLEVHDTRIVIFSSMVIFAGGQLQ